MSIEEQKIALKLIELVKPHASLYNGERFRAQVVERVSLWNKIAVDMNKLSGMNMGE